MNPRHTIISCAVLSALCALPQSATAKDSDGPGVRALIVDERLREREAYVVAIEPGALLLTDGDGREWRSEIRGLIAVLPSIDGETQAVRSDGAVLELTDGQRFPGAILPTSSDGETVRWVHPALGELVFPLDRIDGAHPIGEGERVRDADGARIEDEITLANGDVLRGFLAGFGDPIVFETDGRETSIPADRVESMRLANERVRPEGVYLWLSDGTIARATDIVTGAGRDRMTFTIDSGQSAEYRVESLRGISFDSSRLVPLASLTPSAQSPTGGRIHAEPIDYRASSYDDSDLGRATLGLATIDFPGPMEVRYELPERAARFGGTFTLDRTTAPWGDCVVEIELDGRVLFSQRLHSEGPKAPFTVTASGRELVVRIDPGNYGPILDRVSLERAIVLLRD